MITRPRAAFAFATVIIVLASGLLARHHEATVAHVTDATGLTSHALDTDCHDSAPITHLHALPGDEHADACGLLATLHPSIVFAKQVPLVGQLAIIERATAPPAAHHQLQSPLLLSAPKTSPPVARG